MVRINKSGHRGCYNNAHTGVYKVKNKEKYLGQYAPEYKSKLELLFMRYLDNNKLVKWWDYEPEYIYYLDKSINPPIKRKYFIDFKFCTYGNPEQIHWVEIKPHVESVEPKSKDPRAIKLWIKNSCKWKTARILAESRGYKFNVITENELK